MLGGGLCDRNCGRPSSIRMTKRLGQEGASWALRLVHCVDGCTVSSLFAVFGHSLNTVIIRGVEGEAQPASAAVRAPRPRYLGKHTGQRVSQSKQVFAADPPIYGPVVLYGRPWLGPIHASTNGRGLMSFLTARPFKPAEWASSFFGRPNIWESTGKASLGSPYSFPVDNKEQPAAFFFPSAC